VRKKEREEKSLTEVGVDFISIAVLVVSSSVPLRR